MPSLFFLPKLVQHTNSVGDRNRYSVLFRDFGDGLILYESPDVGYCAGKGLDEIVL